MKSLLLLALVVLNVSGCSEDQHDHPNLTSGEQLFNYHCAECHGQQGTGKLLEEIPAIILTKKNPEEIFTYITSETGHEREMPVFKTMPLEETQTIIDHLFILKSAFDKSGRQIKQFLIEP